MRVTTGFGYYKDDNNKIVAKYILLLGDHALAPGYTFTEVADKIALDKIVVFKYPPDPVKEAEAKAIRKSGILDALGINETQLDKVKAL